MAPRARGGPAFTDPDSGRRDPLDDPSIRAVNRAPGAVVTTPRSRSGVGGGVTSAKPAGGPLAAYLKKQRVNRGK